MRRLGLVCFVALAGSLQASEGAAYLKIPQGARTSGLGSAVVALQGSAEGMWYTPAALAGLKGFEASLSRMAWIGETKNDFLALAIPLGSSKRHGLGIYGNLLSTQDIYRDGFGQEGASFGNSATVLGVAAAFSVGPLTLGLGAKQYEEHFPGLNGGGLAGDTAAQLSFAEGAFRIGTAAQNLGNPLAYQANQGSVAKPPTTYRVGAAFEAKKLGTLASFEYRMFPESLEAAFAAGGQYSFGAGPLGFTLRAGYEGSSARIGGLSGITLGGGFQMDWLVADFAWLPQGALGNPYRMSVGLQF